MKNVKFNKKVYVLLAFAAAWSFFAFKKREVYLNFEVPKHWPKPVVHPPHNRVNIDAFSLGKKLFNDPILSKDNSMSCASCHLNFSAFTHGDHAVSHGIYGLKGTRNSPALFNLAWSKSLMWDGRVETLESQPINPITNPVEMASKMEDVIEKLNHSAIYRKLFYNVYTDSQITQKMLLNALFQFDVMLVSTNSKYDSIQRKEQGVQFTNEELRGYEIYKKNCAACHPEPLFTNQGFENNGLPFDTALKDCGRAAITGKSSDSFYFKVPSLRNVAVSAPYMHDGRFSKLKDVIEHYNSGTIHSNKVSAKLNKNMQLTPQDKKDLVAFLNTLTDKAFLYDVKFRAEVQ